MSTNQSDINLTLGYSTCPNDTFIFYALAHKLIDNMGIKFNIQLADVETLNQNAKADLMDVSKLSFAAIGHLNKTYGLLRSGAALGKGCGPLIVSRPGFDLQGLTSAKIAVPGIWTTACMLLGLYLPRLPDVVPLPFEQIMPLVQNKTFDFGVIIHEGRFTYKEYGLVSLVDLGQWWESKTSLPIPLGGIAIHRKHGKAIAKKVEKIIKNSVLYAFNHREETSDYVNTYAQEMSETVIGQHIDLYVNQFSIDMGKQGAKAVDMLLRMAGKQGLIPEIDTSVFAC
jgi:1,4-dihydroxy-6-naphthoate synthase